MSAKCYDLRVRRIIRVAKIVTFGTSGAVTSRDEEAFVRVPSPRVQCQLSVLNLPGDADTSVSFSPWSFDTAARWDIWPIVEPPADYGIKNVTPNNLRTWTRLPSVFGANNSQPLTDGGGGWSAGYVISGEVNPLWSVSLNPLVIGGGAGVGGWAAICADFTPHPASRMDIEEFRALSNLMQLFSVTSSDANPPLLSPPS